MLRLLPPEEPRVAVFVQDRDVTDSSAVLFSCHLFTRYLSQRNLRRMPLHVVELRFLVSVTQRKCVQSVGEKP